MALYAYRGSCQTRKYTGGSINYGLWTVVIVMLAIFYFQNEGLRLKNSQLNNENKELKFMNILLNNENKELKFMNILLNNENKELKEEKNKTKKYLVIIEGKEIDCFNVLNKYWKDKIKTPKDCEVWLKSLDSRDLINFKFLIDDLKVADIAYEEGVRIKSSLLYMSRNKLKESIENMDTFYRKTYYKRY